jgi:hypothetical protein
MEAGQNKRDRKEASTHNNKIRCPRLNLSHSLYTRPHTAIWYISTRSLLVSLLLQPFLCFLALCRSGGGMVVPFFGLDAEADELADVEVEG